MVIDPKRTAILSVVHPDPPLAKSLVLSNEGVTFPPTLLFRLFPSDSHCAKKNRGKAGESESDRKPKVRQKKREEADPIFQRRQKK